MFPKILLIKLRHHGDVLLTTPVIDALKQAYPNSQIDILVYAETAPVLRDNTQIHRIYTIDRQWKKLGFRQHWQHERALYQALKSQKYDHIINFADQWRAAILVKLLGRPSIGYAFKKRDNALWRASHSQLLHHSGFEAEHMVQTNLAALQPFRLPAHIIPRLRMDISDATRQSFHRKLRHQGWQGESYIAIHPGARWFFKCWDDDKMAQLLQKLLDNGHHLLLTAAPDERETTMLSNLLAQLTIPPNRHIWHFSGSLSIPELAAAIEGSRLFIGVDSLPMHITAALNTPQVALFGPSHVFRWRPYSDKAKIIWAGDFGALPHPDSINTNDETRLLSAIPVDAVWQAVQTQLGQIQTATDASI